MSVGALEWVEVRVTDDGSGMAPRDDSPGRVLGLPLIGYLTDQFEHRGPPGGVGTERSMRFRLSPSGARDPIHPPLISAGRSVECGYNVAYARVTRPTTDHRNLPDVHHSVAIREHRREYERRFVAYFDEALL